MPIQRRSLRLVLALLLLFPALGAFAQDYTSIVVFGDSLSDTGNVAHLTQQTYGIRVPSPVYGDYTDGRFTDGTDTSPAARLYSGVWIEQLAAMLPSKPPVMDSLDGGTNYAYGFATTGYGTGAFTFGPGDQLSVNVSNVGQQITQYLATNPRITSKTLFVVWGGAIDVLYATSAESIVQAAMQQNLNIQRLVQAGATQFIVPNLPPLGDVPRLNTSPATMAAGNQATKLYNDTLAAGLELLLAFQHNPHLTVFQLDVFSLFKKVVKNAGNYGLENVTSMSQDDTSVDPDTYLFWDDLHPTTRGHNILAITAANLLGISAPRNQELPALALP